MLCALCRSGEGRKSFNSLMPYSVLCDGMESVKAEIFESACSEGVKTRRQ